MLEYNVGSVYNVGNILYSCFAVSEQSIKQFNLRCVILVHHKQTYWHWLMPTQEGEKCTMKKIKFTIPNYPKIFCKQSSSHSSLDLRMQNSYRHFLQEIPTLIILYAVLIKLGVYTMYLSIIYASQYVWSCNMRLHPGIRGPFNKTLVTSAFHEFFLSPLLML